MIDASMYLKTIILASDNTVIRTNEVIEVNCDYVTHFFFKL